MKNGWVDHNNITADNTVFVLLSFEGPDWYSLAGGLGVRVTNLANTLAQKGFATHLFFIGSPEGKGDETANGGKLRLHRWCQWISRYYPHGVYQGENEKLYDFNESAPRYVAEHIVKPAVSQGKLVVVLGEEWHTAEAMCRLSDLLHREGLRQKVVMFWNANNTFSFHRIDWKRLSFTTTITTISRYMKHVMWGIGVNPLVIPNGIPKTALNEVDSFASAGFRRSLHADLVLAKVARWDPDKRWLMAIGAIARLKARGIRTVLLARGGIEAHGEEVMQKARSSNLVIKDVTSRGNSLMDYLEALGDNGGADILNIKFHCPPEFLRLVYHASDAVLANSGHEPFGLVGLETMAAGGIAFTGCTGEDYASHLHNAVVLETSDPQEIESYVLYLNEHPEEQEKIRKAGRRTARQYVWDEVLRILIDKLEYQARVQKLLAATNNNTNKCHETEPEDAVEVIESTLVARKFVRRRGTATSTSGTSRLAHC
ncbi:MAG: glycosyltransferase [Chloroflexota bacterium]